MGEFVMAAFSFPAVLFSFLLIVVIGYWLLVLLGVSDVDGLDAADPGVFGLGGVPLSVALTLLTVIAWFLALVSGVLLADTGLSGPLAGLADLGGLLVAVTLALLVTRLVVVPLRRAFPEDTGPSRADFLGRVCVVRTGRVDRVFGQAEVTAADGSSAIVQVRQPGEEPLRAGSIAVIHDYDAAGEFFWVHPVEPTPGEPITADRDFPDQPRPRG